MDFCLDTSLCDINFRKCLQMCGMCPYCIFSPKPPNSTPRLWRVSDKFRRRFVVALLLRCTDVNALESVRTLLHVSTWKWITYARSRNFPQENAASSSYQALTGKPLGVDVKEICNWFNSSPDWMKSNYLCKIFSLCDHELLRMLSNLSHVLLVRQKSGFPHFMRNQQDHYSDPDDPALMVVPGSSRSVSGVSQYRDFIGSLPVYLSKKILGLLGDETLRTCKSVCRYWQDLVDETLQETQLRRLFQDQIKSIMEGCKCVDKVSPTYARITEVEVPLYPDEEDEEPPHNPPKHFEAVYSEVKTKIVKMEERNIYCGAYFCKMLLKGENANRVLDYKGGYLLATNSKDHLVLLYSVASETKNIAAMKGHIGSIRAVVLCEDRDLIITAGCDTTIRCWNWKKESSEMVFYGHTRTVNCLDVHGSLLVSGGKDYTVRVWDIQMWKQRFDFNFKHRSSVLCVKMDSKNVYSACAQGLVKIWNLESGLLLRVLDGHKSSVRTLCFNEYYIVSGDSAGKVLAWSVNCEVRNCIRTFSHPKEVNAVALAYLRVITGCLDGKIRVFNFLTGQCLKDISIGVKVGKIRSLHFHEDSILLNTTAAVQLYQFSKVFWDYTSPALGATRENTPQARSLPETSEMGRVKFPRIITSSSQSQTSAQPGNIFFTMKSLNEERECRKSVSEELRKSEKATNERIRKRGPHHPQTRDAIHLGIGAMQRLKGVDEVGVNMQRNEKLRDAWGPSGQMDLLRSEKREKPHQNLLVPRPFHPLRRPCTCIPIVNQAARKKRANVLLARKIVSASEKLRRSPSPPRTLKPPKPKSSVKTRKHPPTGQTGSR